MDDLATGRLPPRPQAIGWGPPDSLTALLLNEPFSDLLARPAAAVIPDTSLPRAAVAS
jgi:hypothetical protein